MIAFAGMLIEPAARAHMPAPSHDEINEYGLRSRFNGALCDKEKYPHFWVFCLLQLARPMTSPTEHWENAKIIAAIPRERLVTMTVADFQKAGVLGLSSRQEEEP